MPIEWRNTARVTGYRDSTEVKLVEPIETYTAVGGSAAAFKLVITLETSLWL